ncbi:hypothetical protein LXL04_030397 [Taraxacum kok-saghyz]
MLIRNRKINHQSDKTVASGYQSAAGPKLKAIKFLFQFVFCWGPIRRRRPSIMKKGMAKSTAEEEGDGEEGDEAGRCKPKSRCSNTITGIPSATAGPPPSTAGKIETKCEQHNTITGIPSDHRRAIRSAVEPPIAGIDWNRRRIAGIDWNRRGIDWNRRVFAGNRLESSGIAVYSPETDWNRRRYEWNRCVFAGNRLESKNEIPMPTSPFFTDQVFESFDELMKWVQNTTFSLGYVIVKKRSKTNGNSVVSYITLMCDRGGEYKIKEITKNTGTKKINCHFELVGSYRTQYGGWRYVVIMHWKCLKKTSMSSQNSQVKHALKNQQFKKIRVEEKHVNEATISTIPDLNEVPQSCYINPLMNEIPDMFHPYISHIQNVAGDGNCGFRAVAVSLRYDEDQWLYIRKQLLDELHNKYEVYANAFSCGIEELETSLSFFQTNAPREHWMTMPLTGFLIANKFGVIVIFLTKRGSITIFPLWKGPEEFSYHQMITISLVYDNHYMMVQLEGDFPMPTIPAYLRRHKNSCVPRWEAVYKSRLELYQQLKPCDLSFIAPWQFIPSHHQFHTASVLMYLQGNHDLKRIDSKRRNSGLWRLWSSPRLIAERGSRSTHTPEHAPEVGWCTHIKELRFDTNRNSLALPNK